MKIKHVIYIVFIFLLLLGVTGCNENNESETDNNTGDSFSFGDSGSTSQKGNLIWSHSYTPPVYYRFETYENPLNNVFKANGIIHLNSYAYDDDTIYFPSENSIIAVDINSGKRRWQADREARVIGLGENIVFTLTYDNRIYGLDKENGNERWNIILGLLVDSTQSHILHAFPKILRFNNQYYLPIEMPHCNDLHFLHFTTLRLLNINENTGEFILSPCYENIDFGNPIFYSNGIIVAMSNSNEFLYGMNILDGSLKWKFEVDPIDEEFSVIKLEPEENILYIHAYNTFSTYNKIFAIDLLTGSIKWSYNLESGSEPKIVIKNQYILLNFGPSDSDVLVLNKESGKLINSIKPLRGSKRVFFSENGLIFYYYDVKLLTGVDYITGNQLWQEEELIIDEDHYYSIDDTIFLWAKQDYNTVLAIDQKSGKILWTKDLNYNATLGEYQSKLIHFTPDLLQLIEPDDGNTVEIDLQGKCFTYFGGSIEIIDNSLWLIIGVNLTLVYVPPI